MILTASYFKLVQLVTDYIYISLDLRNFSILKTIVSADRISQKRPGQQVANPQNICESSLI
jgi:hypothetical protein